jgi:phosphatidylglycerophosphate synthase
MTVTNSGVALVAASSPPRQAASAHGPIVLTGAGLAAGLAGLAGMGAVSWATIIVALGAFGVVAAGVSFGVRRGHPFGRFGAANGLTLGRAAIACLILGLAAGPQPVAGGGPAAWGPFALAGMAWLSDLFDGALARRQGLGSAFGARFDREVDALLILALSAVAVASATVPAWALGIGLLHYLFAGVGLAVPACRRPLPPSLARRLVCGLQVVALGLLLAPPVSGPPAAAIAAVALAALCASFARDLLGCLRAPRPAGA